MAQSRGSVSDLHTEDAHVYTIVELDTTVDSQGRDGEREYVDEADMRMTSTEVLPPRLQLPDVRGYGVGHHSS